MRLVMAGLLVLTLPVHAQTAPPAAPATPAAPAMAAPAPQRVRGIIDSFDATSQVLGIKTGGKVMSVTLRPKVRVIYNVKLTLAGIKTGDFVGVAALKGADGKLHAQEVHVFPDALRGVNEGQFGVGDPGTNRSMTNAAVAQVASTGAGGTLDVTYHGAAAGPDGVCGGKANTPGSAGCTGEASMVVAPGVPLIGLKMGDESLLIPGVSVALYVFSKPDGTLDTPGLTVEKDGIKPVL